MRGPTRGPTADIRSRRRPSSDASYRGAVSSNRHEADLYFGPRGPNGRGGFVREEPAPYGPAGMATRLKRVAGERLSRPEPPPMDVLKA